MHGPFDKSPKGQPNIYQNWNIKLFALPLLFVVALIGYLVSHPDTAKWVANGMRAEFFGSDSVSDNAPSKRLAHQ